MFWFVCVFVQALVHEWVCACVCICTSAGVCACGYKRWCERVCVLVCECVYKRV